ncbi:hypothetical protein [Thomasclavelia cocleata]|uniref:hypothetical protein n=1 Tax=Thomasclavelia cocleata TaxID=69824 RepID=UPI00242A5CF7|nr:hypothetical protein [Thomasclavelia cocleata]
MIRNLKSNYKIFFLVLAVFFIDTATIKITPILADPEDQTGETESTGKDTESSNVNLSTSNFYTSAIMSIDDNIKSKESNQDYIKNFSNSTVTALSYDLSLVDPDTILMHAIGLVINIFESIGSLVSLVVLIAYNLASSSFWKTAIETIFNTFDTAIFNWSDSNSWFYKIVLLFGLIAVIKKLLSSMKRIVTYKTVVTTIFQVVLSCILIVFIAQQGRSVVSYIDGLVNESISTSFNFIDDQYAESDLPLEINVKNQIFDIMQKQGFTLRHFGVTSASQIPSEYYKTYKGKDYKTSDTGETRLNQLLNDPSTENARIERQTYGSDQIGYSGAQCVVILGESLVFLVHKAFMAFIIGSACIMLFGFCFMKEVSLSLSIYGLVFMLFKNELRVASSWFMSRMKWTIMFIFINLGFNMFLSFIIRIINYISSEALLFLLIFDILIALLIAYVISHWQEIWEKITHDLGISSDSTVIDAGKAILNGNIDPKDVYNNFKDRIAEKRTQAQKDQDNCSDTPDYDSSQPSVSNIKSGDDLADQDETVEADKEVDEDSDMDLKDTEDEFDVDKEFEIERKDDTNVVVKEVDDVSEKEKTSINDTKTYLEEDLKDSLVSEEDAETSIMESNEDLEDNPNDDLLSGKNKKSGVLIDGKNGDEKIETSINQKSDDDLNDINGVDKSSKLTNTIDQEGIGNSSANLTEDDKVEDEEIDIKIPVTEKQKAELDNFLDDLIEEDLLDENF